MFCWLVEHIWLKWILNSSSVLFCSKHNILKYCSILSRQLSETIIPKKQKSLDDISVPYPPLHLQASLFLLLISVIWLYFRNLFDMMMQFLFVILSNLIFVTIQIVSIKVWQTSNFIRIYFLVLFLQLPTWW